MKKIINLILLFVFLIYIFGCSSGITIKKYESDHYYLYEGKLGYYYVDKMGNILSDDGQKLFLNKSLYGKLPVSVRKGNGCFFGYNYGFVISSDKLVFYSDNLLDSCISNDKEVLFYVDREEKNNGFCFYDLNYKRINKFNGFKYKKLYDGNFLIYKDGKEAEGYIVGENGKQLINFKITKFSYVLDNLTNEYYFMVSDGKRNYLFDSKYNKIKNIKNNSTLLDATNGYILYKEDNKVYSYNISNNKTKDEDFAKIYISDDSYITIDGYLYKDNINTNVKALDYYILTNDFTYQDSIVMKDNFNYYRYDLNLNLIDNISIDNAVIDVKNNKLTYYNLNNKTYYKSSNEMYLDINSVRQYRIGNNKFYLDLSNNLYFYNKIPNLYINNNDLIIGDSYVIFMNNKNLYLLNEDLEIKHLGNKSYELIDHNKIIKVYSNDYSYKFYDLKGNLIGEL